MAGQHLLLLRGVRVAHRQLEQEPVELRLGQRVGALVLHRVLRGDDDERIGQRVGLALDRDLALLHRLEQRGLRLRRRAVDLVGQQDVGEHGPGPEPEPAATGHPTVEDELTGHVGGHEVGRELDPLDVEVECGGERLDDEGLGHARHALEQHVPPGQQRRHQARQGAVLPHHHLGHLVAHREDGGTRVAAAGADGRRRGVERPGGRREWRGRRHRAGGGERVELGVRHG